MKKMIFSTNKIKFETVIGIIVMTYMLGLTLCPIDRRFCNTDILLIRSVIGTALLIVAGLIVKIVYARTSKKRNKTGRITDNSKVTDNTSANKNYDHIRIVDMLVGLWLLYYVCRVWFGAEYPCATDSIKTIMMFITYFVLRLFFSFYQLKSRWLIAGIMGCGCYEALFGMLQMLSGTSNHQLFLVTGTFYNPGPYSAYLMLGVVIGLCLIHIESEGMFNMKIGKFKTTQLYYIALLLTAFVIPITWSRSAFIALILICLWIYRDKYRKYQYYIWGIIVVSIVGLYIVKKGSADGRLVIWLSSLLTWTHHPWIGTGVGSFFHSQAEGMAEMYSDKGHLPLFDSADVTSVMCNDFLKIILEQGVVGALLCAAITILTLVKLHRQSQALCYGCVALIIFSMTSYPFELLPYKLIAVLIAAWGNAQHDAEPYPSKVYKYVDTFIGTRSRKVIAVTLCFVVITGLFINNEISERMEKDHDYSLLFAYSCHEAFLTDYYEMLPIEADNSSFLFDFGQTLRNLGRYSDSNAILKIGTHVSNDPMFYVLIGNNYCDMKLYSYAEMTYMKAYAVMPNRLYPIYQLMNLYKKMNNTSKMKKMANRVVEFKEKITSQAIEEMKHKAREILKLK